MQPRISFVTLGVRDLPRATEFYEQVLGLPRRAGGDDVAFFEMGRTWLALFPRHLLAEDAGVPDDGGTFSGVALAHNVSSPEAVDALLAHAAAGGGRVVKPGQHTTWGGYAGYFADPDGFLWEIAWNPEFPHVDDAVDTETTGPDAAWTAHIEAFLRDVHGGDPWHGPSRRAVLDGVTADAAAEHPIVGAHSIWELVLHMTAWTREVTRRLHGATPALPPEGDWPPVPASTPAAWREAVSALEAAHQDLQAAVQPLDPARLTAIVGDQREPAVGTGTTVATMIEGIAAHDAYHSGQIVMLRRALGLSPSA